MWHKALHHDELKCEAQTTVLNIISYMPIWCCSGLSPGKNRAGHFEPVMPEVRTPETCVLWRSSRMSPRQVLKCAFWQYLEIIPPKNFLKYFLAFCQSSAGIKQRYAVPRIPALGKVISKLMISLLLLDVLQWEQWTLLLAITRKHIAWSSVVPKKLWSMPQIPKTEISSLWLWF